MLICNRAYMDGKRIMCKVSGMGCAHVHFCALTMKWSQTDSALDCPGREDHGKNNETGAEHTAEV